VPVPNPQAPTLNPVVPLGMQRGGKLELTLTGTNLAGPTALWTSFPAKVTIPTDANNGKDAAKLRVVLEVPADAPLGQHGLRLATTRGLSNLRSFCLDDLPPVQETETNRSKATAQAVPVPCVVVGRADAEVSDYFKISVKAGQRVTFEMIGRRLGSAFDPQLTLFDKNGRDLPGGFSNDAPGLQTDPRLSYTFKEAGDYVVEIRDVMFRGGADFNYRLRIGDFPCATTGFPLAVQRGVKTSVSFAGPGVEGVAPVEVTGPADPTASVVWLAPRGPSGLYGWPVAVGLSDTPEVVEQEPNDEPAKATRLTPPCAVSARFQDKGDVDHFVFAAKKGQRYILEAFTEEHFSPAEVYMVLKDAKGGQVAAVNPAQAPRIDFTAAADGDYTLTAEHLHYWGGPSETYRVSLTPHSPDFALAIQLDRWDAAATGNVTIPVLVTRRDYTGPIELSVAGHPGLSGQLTVATGQPPNPATPVQLVVNVKGDLPPGPITFRIEGKATINGKAVVREASARTALVTSFANLASPPPQFENQIGLAVKERPAFTLKAQLSAAQAEPGQTVTLTVTASRAPNFTEEIALTLAGLPPTIKATPVNIAKGANEAKIPLVLAPGATAAAVPVTVTGKAKHQGADVTAAAAPVSLAVVVIPFELKVEPAPVTVAPGAKVKLKVVATRKTYQGPITLALRNLPAGVTAPAATIPQGQAQVEVELTAAANAAVGDKADVNVLGTATAAGNATRPSPNFTVRVQK
jgi:hypothetical protein